MPYRLNVDRLRAAAKDLGDTSDYKIYKRAGISRGTMSRLVNQLGEPSLGSLMRLHKTYRVPLLELIRDTESKSAA